MSEMEFNKQTEFRLIKLEGVLNESELLQLFQQSQYYHQIFIISNLSENKACEIGRQFICQAKHLKKFKIEFSKNTLNNLSPLMSIAENIYMMKDLQDFSLVLMEQHNCIDQSEEIVELITKISLLENLQSVSLTIQELEKISKEKSKQIKKSFKMLKRITSFEYGLKVWNLNHFQPISLQYLMKGLKYLNNLVVLSLNLENISQIENISMKQIAESLLQLINLEQLTLKFGRATNATDGAFFPFTDTLRKLRNIKQLYFTFHDAFYNFKEQIVFLDSFFEMESLESLKVSLAFQPFCKIDMVLGGNTFINSNISNIELTLTCTDQAFADNSLCFDENILRITKLQTIKISFINFVFGDSGHQVLSSFLKNNSELKQVNLKEINFYQAHKFFQNLNSFVNASTNLMELSLGIKNIKQLESLQNSFINCSSQLERLSLLFEFSWQPCTFDFNDCLKHLSSLKVFSFDFKVKEASHVIIETFLLALQQLSSLNSLTISIQEFRDQINFEVFQLVFQVLSNNLKQLSFTLYPDQNNVIIPLLENLFHQFRFLINLQHLSLFVIIEEFEFDFQQNLLAESLTYLQDLRSISYFHYIDLHQLDQQIKRKNLRMVNHQYHYGY